MSDDEGPALQPAKRFDWERIVRRCRIPAQTKFVAYTLAQYGDHNGQGIRPGLERLAAVCEMGERTIKRHLAALIGLGLIERLANGGGRNQRASVYRLTVPEDLLERVDLLNPDEVTQANRVAPVASAQPVDNSGTQATTVASVPDPWKTELGPSETELGPSEALTRATQVAHHQGDHPRVSTNQTSPEVSTSPVDPQPLRRPRSRADPWCCAPLPRGTHTRDCPNRPATLRGAS